MKTACHAMNCYFLNGNQCLVQDYFPCSSQKVTTNSNTIAIVHLCLMLNVVYLLDNEITEPASKEACPFLTLEGNLQSF